jgi:hypothetical protein
MDQNHKKQFLFLYEAEDDFINSILSFLREQNCQLVKSQNLGAGIQALFTKKYDFDAIFLDLFLLEEGGGKGGGHGF